MKRIEKQNNQKVGCCFTLVLCFIAIAISFILLMCQCYKSAIAIFVAAIFGTVAHASWVIYENPSPWYNPWNDVFNRIQDIAEEENDDASDK